MSNLIGAVLSLAIILLIELFAIKVGWQLFMVPTFKLQELDWEQAMGLCLLMSCMKANLTKRV